MFRHISWQHSLHLTVCLLLILPSIVMAQIVDVRGLNVNDIRALDRQRTAIILPGGILEEHGPYIFPSTAMAG